MEENATTWIVHFFAKLCVLGKHKGVRKIEGSCVLLPCLFPWSHFCSASYQPNNLQPSYV